MGKSKFFLRCLWGIFGVCGMLEGCRSVPAQNTSLQGRVSQKAERQTVDSQTASGGAINKVFANTASEKTFQNTLYNNTLTVFQNNFSVPVHTSLLQTSLCGVTRDLSIAIGVRNYPQPLRTGDKCVQNACFDTQTGTYITADGTRRVCR